MQIRKRRYLARLASSVDSHYPWTAGTSSDMDAAIAELDKSGSRQTKLDRCINECKEKLAALHQKHSKAGGGRGSGRWNKGDQNAKDALEGNLKDARDGFLPGERLAAARASAASVQESARQNAAHHARSEPPPSGRPAINTAGSGGAAGGSGAAASRAPGDDAPDHDDGEEDDALRNANYYTVSAQQRAFNEEKMRAAGSSSGAAGSSAAHAASGAAALSERERMYSALQFNENWAKLRIKYDPRHWMGNWFLMAASKTSPLFKYFCCATADAMFKVGTNPDPNPNPNPNPN